MITNNTATLNHNCHYIMAQTSTKSIDVGGVFLMDLSVNESESSSTDLNSNGLQTPSTWKGYVQNQSNNLTTKPNYYLNGRENSMISKYATSRLDYRSGTATSTTQPPTSDYLGSSLDRLESVINCDGYREDMMTSNEKDDERSLTIIGSNAQDLREPQSSCSMSDESFVTSSGTSLSVSLSDQENDDKQSTTTREDSGVLDMKDLEGHDERKRMIQDQGVEYVRSTVQEKSISDDTMAANLINKLASSNNNIHYHHQTDNLINYNKLNPHRSICKPTDGSNINNHNNYHHRGSNRSKHAMSASLPIKVPVRKMKKDLNNMKLNMLKEEESAIVDQTAPSNVECDDPVRKGDRNRPAIENIPAFDDDAFLDQEYNTNHHNHYPLNDLDDEHLTAEDDPMKLFASIQALAKSLHEDAELFGSLPPKRTLESPIRSIALV